MSRIEAPSNVQKHTAAMQHGAQLLANGQSTLGVINDLRKRGLTNQDIEEEWVSISNSAGELIKQRRQRVRIIGVCWLALGGILLGGFLWALIYYGSVPLFLLLGLIPLIYGVYLLRLSPTEEPKFEHPRFFGHNL